MKLYKYCAFDLRSQRVLLTKEVWYSARSTLNDPFDCTPIFNIDIPEIEIDELLDYTGIESISSFSLADKKELLKESHSDHRLNNTGVYCLSRDPADELMWAHYGNNHYGIVIGWEVEEGPSDLDDPYPMWPQAVDYCGRGVLNASDVLAFARHMNGIDLPPGVLASAGTMKAVDAIPAASYLAKNPAWEREQEVRFVSPDKQGLLPFDADIESITYGCRFDRSLIP